MDIYSYIQHVSGGFKHWTLETDKHLSRFSPSGGHSHKLQVFGSISNLTEIVTFEGLYYEVHEIQFQVQNNY